jgi:hypothetical protein
MKPNGRALFVLLIGLSVVSFWRGAWGIMDTYLFPNSYELSSWVSILIGSIILYVTHYWTKELA